MSKRYLKYETEVNNPLVDENGVLNNPYLIIELDTTQYTSFEEAIAEGNVRVRATNIESLDVFNNGRPIDVTFVAYSENEGSVYTDYFKPIKTSIEYWIEGNAVIEVDLEFIDHLNNHIQICLNPNQDENTYELLDGFKIDDASFKTFN